MVISPLGGVLIFLFMLASVNAVLAFLTEGQGVIIEKINRPGGLWVVTADGGETLIPPTRLWIIIQSGEHLVKKPYSFIYEVNHIKHNAIVSLLETFGGIWLAIYGMCVLLRIVRLIYQFINKQLWLRTLRSWKNKTRYVNK